MPEYRCPPLVMVVVLLAACGTQSVEIDDVVDGRGWDGVAMDQAALVDVVFAEKPGSQEDDAGLDVLTLDLLPETVDLQPQCEPGEGCLLDPCTENEDCDSGWCVNHLGESVCTQSCVSECPAGWRCVQVGEANPDALFICVSDFPVLCRPCRAAADCTGASGQIGACIDYGDNGDFCGGACEVEGDCPWGFACQEVETVEGQESRHCVAKTGECPCADSAVDNAASTTCQVINDWGTCVGQRVCTEAGLTPCDAQTPGEEVCNGLDDDCDGDVDEPPLMDGEFGNLCDDDNECTDDACLGGDGCQNTPLSDVECVDGDPCTVVDQCVEGLCQGTLVECDDGNLCTTDSCDGFGGCTFEAAPGLCDDGDACTVGDSCGGGACQPGVPANCADDNPCTDDSCDPEMGCLHIPNESPCEDGNPCTVNDSCQTGDCVGGGPFHCDDANPCTDDSCDPALGCVYALNGAECDDGNACTSGDHCAMGVCSATVLTDCNDDNPCTDDTCDPGVGCLSTLNEVPCSDGNICTSGDQCAGGICVGGDVISCADDNPCTTESCDPEVGCVSQDNTLACEDGNPCTVGDVCANGGCAPGAAASCDDGNPCTDDSCDPQAGCLYVPNQAACSDGNACTTGDHCALGVCAHDGLLACDDDNVCTNDTCDPNLGCQFVNNTAPCTDANVCTVDDTCSAGICVSGAALNCDDNSICTDDSCHPQLGCQFVPKDWGQAPQATSNSPACEGGQIQLSVAESEGAEYLWKGPGGFLSSLREPVLSGVTEAQAGTYTVTLSYNGCTGPSSSLDVAVNPASHGVKTFNWTGSPQSWVIPECAEWLTVEAYGAKGGLAKSNPSQPGLGGKIQAVVPVTPGETLYVYVGGAGSNKNGGYNGGGNGSYDGSGAFLLLYGGGGGGASDIRLGSQALSARLVVAGGGGGAGRNGGNSGQNGGGGGGLVGQNGTKSYSGASVGTGGSQSSGGSSGGGLGVGGNGTYTQGGGGGGGYYGGGGASYAGGGGGSSFAIDGSYNVVHAQGVRDGGGQVTVSW